MEKVPKKKYRIELLYANGVVEAYPLGEATEEELKEMLNVPYLAFQSGSNGVLQLPGNEGEIVLVNLQDITRLSVKEVSENN